MSYARLTGSTADGIALQRQTRNRDNGVQQGKDPTMTNSWCPQNFPAEAAQDMNHTPMLAMLHTVPGLVTDMETLASDTVRGLRVLHYVDESLLQDTIAKGTTPGHVRRRLVDYARYAEESGAQALLVSCSSIGEAATAAQDFVSIPVLRIDTPMAERRCTVRRQDRRARDPGCDPWTNHTARPRLSHKAEQKAHHHREKSRRRLLRPARR